jgi:hypothetical protein
MTSGGYKKKQIQINSSIKSLQMILEPERQSQPIPFGRSEFKKNKKKKNKKEKSIIGNELKISLKSKSNSITTILKQCAPKFL